MSKTPEDLLLGLGADYPPHVLAAIRSVPRHWFVSEIFRDIAYQDVAIQIKHGVTTSRPSTIAKMISAIGKPMRVLEIGTGSGWQTALLSTFTTVFTVEFDEALMERAMRDLRDYDVAFRHGDGMEGWPENAPYGAIILSGSIGYMPHVLLGQLTKTGILVAQIGDEIAAYRKDGTIKTVIGKGRFKPMWSD